MNKKALFITIQIFILIVAVISPKILAENQVFKLDESNGFRIFKFNTTTTIKEISDFSEPLDLNKSYTVDVAISFNFELPKFFPKLLLETKMGNWVIFRDINHNMTVDIQLETNDDKIPEWCHTEIENKTITMENFTTEAKTIGTKLFIKLDSDAPALEKVTIEISAKFVPDSNWGLKASEYIENFTIIPEFNGSLKAGFSVPTNTTKIITKSNGYTILPVNITNIGNGESFITAEVDGIETGWNITLEPNNITIPAGNTKTINVNITSPQDEEEKIMNLSLIIKSKSTSNLKIDDKYLQGQTIILPALKLIKEDKTEKIDFTIIILGLIVIILSLIIIVFFFKKKK